jgi:hypothetical protein
MADDRIEIEITMDDGKVAKGFANIANAAEKTGKKISDSVSEGGIKEAAALLAGPMTAAIAGVAAAGYGLKKAFDFAMEGEAIAKIGNQFDFLAERAGIAGASLRAALKGSSGGTIDDTDLMQAANRAMIELGAHASKLPQILELARQSAAIFGGEAVDKFELINQAIASGNTRALRQAGLFIDGDKAIKDYARSLGVSADMLTQAGKQQAVLNAVLEKGKTAFEGIKVESSTTDSVKRLGVAFNDLKESLKVMFADFSGSAFKGWVDSITSSLGSLSDSITARFGKGADQAAAKTRKLSEEIGSLQKELDEFKNRGWRPADALFDKDSEIKRFEGLIAQKKMELDDLRKAENMLSPGQSGGKKKGGGSGGPQVDMSAVNARLIQQEQMLGQMRSANLSMQEQQAQDILGHDERLAELQRLGLERKTIIEQEYQAKVAETRKLYDEGQLIDHEDMTQKLALLEEERALKLKAVKDPFVEKQLKQDKDIRDALNATFRDVGTGAIAAFGAALVKGGKAFSDFGKALLGMLGDLAIKLGTILVFSGEGIKALQGLNGFGAVAAGIGLIAIGGALKAMSSGGGADSSAAGGGGSYSSGSTLVENPDQEQKKAQTQVVVNVQGNVLDRRESGLAIVEILNEHFSANDGRLIGVSA